MSARVEVDVSVRKPWNFDTEQLFCPLVVGLVVAARDGKFAIYLDEVLWPPPSIMSHLVCNREYSRTPLNTI